MSTIRAEEPAVRYVPTQAKRNFMDFQAAYNLVIPVVEKKYGVEVMISDAVDPNTGDFDGQTILLD